jgi:arylsulfatase A-like enzyme
MKPSPQSGYLILLIAWAIIGLSACNRPQDFNVILISVDTLRQDHISFQGYPRKTTPAIDRLAQSGFAFTQGVVHSPITAPSHASILTGLMPAGHGVRTNGSYVLDPAVITLPEILKEHDYSTAAFVSCMVLSRRFGFAQGFDEFDDDFSQSRVENSFELEKYGLSGKKIEQRAEEVLAKAQAWLDRNRRKKFFLWVHFFDPHSPYAPPKPYDEIYYSGGNPSDPNNHSLDHVKAFRYAWLKWLAPITDIEYPRAQYDAEISYTDDQIDKLIQDIDADPDLQKRTIIVLTSDHGESLGEHDYYFFHGDFLFDEAVRVPIYFRLPGQIPAGQKSDIQVQQTDILPTLLALLGLPAKYRQKPISSDGQSLAELIRRNKPGPIASRRFVYAEATYRDSSGSGCKMLRSSDWKFIFNEDMRMGELYDLRHDPHELSNVLFQNIEVAKEMEIELKKRIFSQPSQPLRQPSQPDPATQKALKSLGYVQ